MYLFEIISSKAGRPTYALERGLSNREAKRSFLRRSYAACNSSRPIDIFSETVIQYSDGERIAIA